MKLALGVFVAVAIGAFIWLFCTSAPVWQDGAPTGGREEVERATRLATTPDGAVRTRRVGSGGLSIRGTVVDWNGERGLEGALVSLMSSGLVVARESTDAQGQFELTNRGGLDWFHLAVQAKFYLPITVNYRERAEGAIDLGLIRLTRGGSVVGRVTTLHGVPLSGVGVFVGRQDPAMGMVTSKHAWSDAAGRFSIDGRIEPGRWGLLLKNAPSLVSADEFTVGENGHATLEIHVQEPIAIDGYVVNEQGEALAHVPVEVLGQPGMSTFTSRDGRLEMHLPRTIDRGLRLRFGPTTTHAVCDTDIIQPGQRGLRWILRSKPVIHLTVRDAVSGAAITCYGVSLVSACGTDGGIHIASAEHANGEVTIAYAGAGDYMLAVLPRDKGYVPALPSKHSLDGRSIAIDVRLQRVGEVTVRVIDNVGAPVANSVVELIAHLEGKKPLADALVAPMSLSIADSYRASSLSGSWCVSVGRGTTNAEGRVSLAWHWREGRLLVRVKGAEHESALIDVPPLTTEEIPVMVNRSGSIEGSLSPLTQWKALNEGKDPLRGVSVELMRSGGLGSEVVASRSGGVVLMGKGRNARFPLDPHSAIPVSETGSFRANGVPGGDWDVLLKVGGMNGNASGQDGVILRPAVAQVRVTPGTVTRCTLEIGPALQTCELTGTCRMSGLALGGAELLARYGYPRADGTVEILGGLRIGEIDKEGHFGLKRLLPMHYRIDVGLRGTSGGREWIPGSDWFAVSGGQRHAVDIDVVFASVTLRCGEQLREPGNVLVSRSDGSFHRRVGLDGHGIGMVQLPEGEYLIRDGRQGVKGAAVCRILVPRGGEIVHDVK